MIPLLLFFQVMFPPADLARFHEQRIAQLKQGSAEARAAHKDLGLFWLRNNNPAEAESHLRQALPDSELTPFLAEALAAQHRDAEADAFFKQCATARCLGRLAERTQDPNTAIQYLRQAVKIEPTPVRRNDLAQALHSAGDIKEAEALFRQAIREQDSNHPEAGIVLNNLASLLTATGRHDEAEPLQRKALASMQRNLGPRHVRTGLAASNLADILRARGQETEAIARYRQALGIFESALAPDHPWILEARQALTK